MICPHCHKKIPTDSTFCTFCGKNIQVSKHTKDEIETQKEGYRYDKLSFILFLMALILFDFVIGSIVATLGMNHKPVFVMSFIIYILAISTGILDLIKAHKAKTSMSRFAIVSIVMSIYFCLLNFTQVILK